VRNAKARASSLLGTRKVLGVGTGAMLLGAISRVRLFYATEKTRDLR
jgi:hypothetical protein